MSAPTTDAGSIPILAADVPVTMPELPPHLTITTAQQFKAIADPVRSRILGIIQNQPATAKQIADRLGIWPGAAGHHLHVLEAAGLAQVAAKRLVRGIVAKYYTRTARIFAYDMPREVTGGVSTSVEIMTSATNELTESLGEGGDERCLQVSFPHARLSPERAKVYEARLSAIVEDLLHEPPDADGAIYGVSVALFLAPKYMQGVPVSIPNEDSEPEEGAR
ncbi:MAG TPA: winged helix-turn-helix domain-containing protein [Ktedonobacterales bacterium]|nr:winged helix-turn-helix domain-containing protein [Ktedonobacterales bacterium]